MRTFVLILFFTLPAAAFEVSRPVEVGPSFAFERTARLATNGDGYLTVWVDVRGDAPATVRGMLLDGDEQPRRDADFGVASAIRTSPENSTGFILDLESDGRDYLVAWSDLQDTHLIAVTRDGIVTPSPDTLPGLLRSLVAVRGYYIAVLQEPWSDASLAILDGRGRLVRKIQRLSDFKDAALFETADGRLMLLGSRWYGRIEIAFLTLGDLFAPRQPRIVSSRTELHDLPYGIAESDGHFLLVQSNLTYLSLYLLDENGALLQQEDLKFPELGILYRMDAARLGAGFVLVANGIGDRLPISTLRLTADLQPIGTFERIATTGNDEIAVRALPDQGVALAYANRDAQCCVQGTHAVRVQRLSPAGVNRHDGEGVVVSRNVASQEGAVVKQCGDIFMTAWEDHWETMSQIRFRRFRSDGTPLDPPNRAVLPTADGEHQDVSLTCGKNSILLTWWDVDTYRRRLAFVPMEGDGIKVDSIHGSTGAATFDGQDFVLFTLGYDDEFLFSRWSEQGTHLYQQNQPGHGGSRVDVAFAWTGQYFLLATTEDTTGRRFSMYRPVLRRMDRNFIPIGPDIDLGPTQGTFFYTGLRIASAPEGTIAAAWGVCPIGGTRDLCSPYSMLIDRDGALRDPLGGILRGAPRPERRVAWMVTFPLDVWSSGSGFELLSEQDVTKFDLAGRTQTLQLAPDAGAHVAGLTQNGDRRLVVYWRTDPASGLRRLFADFVDVSWDPPAPRRRSVGH